MSKHQPGLTIRFWLIVLGISILGTLILGTSSWSTLPGVLTTACAQAIDDPSGVVVAESPDYGEFFCETPSIIVLKNGHW